MNKEDQNIADVQFILNEVERFLLMSPKEVFAYLRLNRGDMFAHLDRSGGGILFCGRKAYDRFGELADRTIQVGSREAKSFDRRDYVRALRTAFVELFIDEGNPITQGSVARLINRAKQRATDTLVQFVHHIPCALFYDEEPSKFNVGPVTFTRSDRFLSDFEKSLNDYQQLLTERFATGLQKQRPALSSDEAMADAGNFAQRQLADIRDYYCRYNWGASVSIPACHEAVSKLRAERTIDAALDVLRLFVTSNPQRYRRGNAPNAPFDMHELTTDALGKVRATFRREAQGGPAGKGWYEALLQRVPWLWALFEKAIALLPGDEKVDELNQRLLDALNWFGQAIVEQNAGAKIVKYAAALERLTVTSHINSGIEALVIKRVRILNQDREDKAREQIEKDIGDVYQCRSDLMHGSLSPYDASITNVLRIASEITRWSIFSTIQLFSLLREEGKANRKALGVAYDGGRREKPHPESNQTDPFESRIRASFRYLLSSLQRLRFRK